MEVMINNDNFKTEVLDYSGMVIVDFYGSWCMPCKMIAPIVEKICNEKNIKLAKVDVDENETLVRNFKIMSVPTLKIFKDGKEISTIVGVTNEAKILQALEN